MRSESFPTPSINTSHDTAAHSNNNEIEPRPSMDELKENKYLKERMDNQVLYEQTRYTLNSWLEDL